MGSNPTSQILGTLYAITGSEWLEEGTEHEKKLFVSILSLLTLLSSFFVFIEYKDVVKAQKEAGHLLSNEVNNMSIFVQGVRTYISQEAPKPDIWRRYF